MNGETPYIDMDEDDIRQIKNSDRELTTLMNQLPPGTPDHFETVITSLTRYNPPERASLATVRQIMGLDDDTRYHYSFCQRLLSFFGFSR